MKYIQKVTECGSNQRSEDFLTEDDNVVNNIPSKNRNLLIYLESVNLAQTSQHYIIIEDWE